MPRKTAKCLTYQLYQIYLDRNSSLTGFWVLFLVALLFLKKKNRSDSSSLLEVLQKIGLISKNWVLGPHMPVPS